MVTIYIFSIENSQVLWKYKEIVLPLLTFIINPIMNLISGHHHECEKMEHHSSCSKSTEELL